MSDKVAVADSAISQFEATEGGRLCCMSCFRAGIRDMLPEKGERLVVKCVYKTASSSRCSGCGAKNDSCSGVPGLLQGDWEDFCVMSEWVGDAIEEVDDDDEEERLLNEQARFALASAQFQLAKSFEALEAAHRALWGLTGAKKTQGEAPRRYLKVVEARRARLVSSFTPMSLGATAARREMYAVATTPRSILGDPFFAAWGAAKKSFFAAVNAMIEDEDPDLLPPSLIADDHPVRRVQIPKF